MAKFNFYLKDSQGWNPQEWKQQGPTNKTDIPTPVVLFVHYEARRIKIHIKETARPSEWDFKNQQFKTTRAVTNAIGKNARLRTLKEKAEFVYYKYLNDNDQESPSPGVFKDLIKIEFKLKSEPKKDLFDFFQQIIDQKKYDLGDKPERNSDLPSYRYTLEALQQFAGKKRQRVDFDTISLQFYHDFKKFLIEDLKLKTNTVGVRIQRLKSVLKRATASGLNSNLIYTDPSFKTMSEESRDIYLTEPELEKLQDLKLSNELEVVRDLFLVLAWTGLRESDIKQVNPNNITNNTLQIKQQKTGGRISIPLHPVVIEILKKYDNNIPTRAQQYFNRKLKGIGAELSNEMKLSDKDYSQLKTHTGRRSFASNMILRGIPAREVMAVTGHKTEKDFFRYLKMAPVELNGGIRLSFQKDVKLKKAQ